MTDGTRHRVYLIAAFATTSVLNYAFSVGLSWYFTPAEFGVLGVAQSLLLLMALLVGSGFAWTAAHDVAAHGINPTTRLRFRAAWTANLGLGVVIGLGLWAAYAAGLLPLGPAYRLVIPAVSLTVIVLSVRAVTNGAARGLQRFGPTAVNLAGEVVIKVAVGLGLVALGAGVGGVMVAFLVGALASLAHSLAVIRPERMWQGPGWFDGQVFRRTASLFVSMLGTAMMLNLDVLGLKLFAPLGQGDQLSGYYQAAVILARTPIFLAQALTLVLFSHVAGVQRVTARSEDSALIEYLYSAGRSWTRFLLPAALTLILAPQAALTLFFPPQYGRVTLALQVASAGGALLALVTLINGVLQAAGKRRQPAGVILIAAIIQVISLAWLVPRIGILGAAASLLIAGLVALAGLGLPLAVHLRPAAGTRSGGLQLLRRAFPALALAVPLLLIPEGRQATAVLKFGLAAASYLLALLIVHRHTFDLNKPIPIVMAQIFQVLIGS